jgi:bifunctional DNase/RNase
MIPVKVKEIAFDVSMNPVVLLVDEAEVKVLPIWIGPFEAHAIAMALEGVEPPRPMTHDLLKKVCDHLGAGVSRVVISDVRDGTYYAELYLRRNGEETVLDARPSDAIALALRSVAPIFISEKLAEYTLAIHELTGEAQQQEGGKVVEFRPRDPKKSLH